MAKKGKKEKGKAKEEKKAKAPKKTKEIVVKTITHKKSEHEKDINPATGSRFSANTSKQTALDVIVASIEDGKDIREIRKVLADHRKENGKEKNLDAGYLAFCVASHPEYFEVKTDNSIQQVKKFKPDPEAAKKQAKLEEERKAKKSSRKGKDKGKKKGGKKNKGGKPTLNGKKGKKTDKK